MRIISRKILKEFWSKPNKGDSKQALKSWYIEAQKAKWNSPSRIKEKYRNASFIGNDRVVFNIAGNKYRLIVAIKYKYGIIYIRFIGTHSEYDKIDASNI